jgi:predicted DNA-binding transcriptional regulator YafY
MSRQDGPSQKGRESARSPKAKTTRKEKKMEMSKGSLSQTGGLSQTGVPSRTGGASKAEGGRKRKSGAVTAAATSDQAARYEEYHEYFSQMFYDRNPKKRYPSHKQLGKIVGGYSVSTVKRDIEVMRRVYKLPIEEIEEYGGWGYTEEVVKSPTVQMTKGHLVLICMAWKSLEGCRGTPGQEQVAEAFEKLLQALGPKLAADLRKVKDRISFWTASHFAPVQPEVFEAVANALFEDEELRFEYQKLEDGNGQKVAANTDTNTNGADHGAHGKNAKPSAKSQAKPPVERRHGQPRQLLYYDGGWYLYTDDIPSGLERRKFMLTRMKSARGTGVRFVPKDEFKLEEELRGFGIHSDGKEKIVRVRYSGMSAKLVSERTYHGMQSMCQNEDGTVDLTLKTVIAPELKRFVLGSGSEAEVLEPAEFGEQVVAEARRVVERAAGEGARQ